MKPTQAQIGRPTWEIVCLAYHGDTKPCATPCLHCDRIASALTAAAEAGENEIEKLRRQRIEFDCRYTMGKVADLTGNHCPIDKPCLRCQNERLEAATIERCAQVAYTYAMQTLALNKKITPQGILDAIRAMKEET